jgi:putative Holliday junction resolvase
LALDPGVKRIGVAVSDSGETLAFPRPALAGDGEWMMQLRALLEDEPCHQILVGLPVSLNGSDTASTQYAREMWDSIRLAFADIQVIQIDERLTTVAASRQLSSAGKNQRDQRDVIDSAAAVVLLQGWLDAKH